MSSGGVVRHRVKKSGRVDNNTANNNHTVSMSDNQTYWLCPDNISKRDGETFFLIWTAIWISIVAIIVATQIFEIFTPWHYMAVGFIIMTPCIAIPLLFPSEFDSKLHWTERYSTKANAWCFVISFVANYGWTHYFYQILGAKYTFVAHRLNDVPICLYMITHSYFITYHTLSTVVLRKLGFRKPTFSSVKFIAVVLAMSYFVAFMETFSIQNFPYYNFKDTRAMYVYGLVFYALYFVVSFPMFLRIDENIKQKKWTVTESILDSFAACMMITLLLDFWRLVIGPVF